MQYHEEDVPTIDFSKIITEAYEQAKAMEKEQIENACDKFANSIDFTIEDFERYYNETYDTRRIH